MRGRIAGSSSTDHGGREGGILPISGMVEPDERAQRRVVFDRIRGRENALNVHVMMPMPIKFCSTRWMPGLCRDCLMIFWQKLAAGCKPK
jgi:hypothetical protein